MQEQYTRRTFTFLQVKLISSYLSHFVGTLKPGNNYTFTFTATNTSSSSVTVIVVTQYDSLVAVIAGGNRVIGLDSLVIVLDGR